MTGRTITPLEFLESLAELPDPGKRAGWLAHDITRMKMTKPRLRRIVVAALQAESEAWFRD